MKSVIIYPPLHIVYCAQEQQLQWTSGPVQGARFLVSASTKIPHCVVAVSGRNASL